MPQPHVPSDPVDPSADFAYWRGGVDNWREATGRTLGRLDRRQEELDRRQDELDKELSTMRAKVAAGAAIGSIVGGGIVTFIVAIGSKAFGG